MSARRAIGIVVLFTVAPPLAAATIIIAGIEGSGTLPADCALVFGSALLKSGEPGPGLQRRIATAARLWNEKQVRTLVVTGGRPDGAAISEAEAMAERLHARQVPAGAIRTEMAARSTWENLVLSKPLLQDCESVIAVSDGYHLARIRLLAWRQGWGSLPTYPADDPSPVASHLRNIARETAAYLYYVVPYVYRGSPEASLSIER
ncbi:MAG: hypothetical protein G01um101425_575 [Candidatus Peregrinibacteria bacterium Gr01-1014_25]|nr:MAG: hypothetical protein G01um101425_575 [Candidatus Peregrinibacteria bacterium Gr01-1014_25]